MLLFAFHLTAGDDYEFISYTVNFTAGQLNATLMVSTVDDSTTELSEYFKVVITSTSLAVTVLIGSPNVTIVTILDNDPGNMQLCNIASVDIIIIIAMC